MTARRSALDVLWKLQGEDGYKEGLYQGGNEAFASMVIYGECTILGRVVQVRFEWPDETFAAQVRELSSKVLERARAEGRQVDLPPQTRGNR